MFQRGKESGIMNRVFDDIEDNFDRMFFDNEEEQSIWDSIRDEIICDDICEEE